MINLKEEMRQEMKEQSRFDAEMRESLDNLLEAYNAYEIIEKIEQLKAVAISYGYDAQDVRDYIRDNI